MTDIVKELAAVSAALSTGAGPNALYGAIDQAVKRLVGHKLFTLLVVVDGGKEVERIYSNEPVAYPLTGRKPMGVTPWSDHVMGGLKPWLGHNAEDIKWAFSDHELIASLGCASCINIPVIRFGTMLGTMNVLDAENAYDQADVETLALFAPALALPFAEAAKGIDKTA
jgi:hypothetical protein